MRASEAMPARIPKGCSCTKDSRQKREALVRTQISVQHAIATIGSGELVLEGLPDDPARFAAVASCLRCFGEAKALSDGRRLHNQMMESGYCHSTFLRNCLLKMYGDCGSLEDAQAVFAKTPSPDLYSWNILIKAYGQNGFLDNAKRAFTRMPRRDIVSWTSMISLFVQNGNGKGALDLHHQMVFAGVKPNKITFICVVNACASLAALEVGSKIHAAIVASGYEQDAVVGTALVSMYGKCRSIGNSRSVFDRISHQDVVSWTAMIAALAENGYGKESLVLFEQMCTEAIDPNSVTLVCALDACASLGALEEGQKLHVVFIDSRYQQDVVVGTALISMYGKCQNAENARRVFGRMPHRNIISWNAMISAFTQNGHGKEALSLLYQMQSEGIKPDDITFVSALDACASLAALGEGYEIHIGIVDSAFELDFVVGTALVNMYGKCGNLDEARNVFNRMLYQNVVSWNAMLAALLQNGHCKEALDVFYRMKSEGMKPDKVTFISSLDACARLSALKKGQEIHAATLESGDKQDTVMGTALLNMYGKCDRLGDARSVFSMMPQQDVCSWTAMIAVLVQNGHCREALDLFQQMQCEGIRPNCVTLACAVDACACLVALGEGKNTHALILESQYDGGVEVGNVLISMYGKCRILESARSLFDSLCLQNAVSWTALIAAFAQIGKDREALDLLHQMQLEGVEPNNVTLTCAVNACASLTTLHRGQEIHAAIVDCGYGQDIMVGNALINMYGKCGSLENGRSIFGSMPTKDVVSWTALIAAFARNGNVEEALTLFCQMQFDDVKPNGITWISVLTACSHTGLVDEGRQLFSFINVVYGAVLTVQHCVCMIDLLGRAGHLDEAEHLFNSMPFEEIGVGWLCLLGACKIHGDVKREARVAKYCFQSHPGVMMFPV